MTGVSYPSSQSHNSDPSVTMCIHQTGFFSSNYTQTLSELWCMCLNSRGDMLQSGIEDTSEIALMESINITP